MHLSVKRDVTAHPRHYTGSCHEDQVVVHSVVSDSCDPVDRSPPGPSVHGVLQARMLEWVAISFSRGSSQPRD